MNTSQNPDENVKPPSVDESAVERFMVTRYGKDRFSGVEHVKVVRAADYDALDSRLADLTAICAELRGELATIKRQHAEYRIEANRVFGAAERQLAEARGKIEWLLVAIKKYGKHPSGCGWYDANQFRHRAGRCTCGLDAFLNPPQQPAGE